MTGPDVFALKRSGLSDILFADVGTEPNGMTLSLLSALARSGTDPWQEAGRLAALPKPEAISSLARTIAGLPASLWPLPVATTIATRLIALLPSRSATATGTVAAALDKRTLNPVAMAILLGAAILLGLYLLGFPSF